MSLIFAHNDNSLITNQASSFSIRPKKVCRYLGSQMHIRGTSRSACPKAVLTIEATIVLPFFVCFMVFVLYFFRILQVQSGVAQALQYAGRKTAAEYNINKESDPSDDKNPDSNDIAESDLSGMLKARLYFHQQLKKQDCLTQFIQRGASGISLLQSNFSEEYVELKAVYKMKFPIRLLGNIQYRIVQESKCRKWIGCQSNQTTQENDDTWLYYTEYGTVYHASRTCTHLDLSIRAVTYSQAEAKRNNSGGKYHECEKCSANRSQNGMVYITSYGNRYHYTLTCSGLKRSIYMIRRSEATDKRMCSKCGSS